MSAVARSASRRVGGIRPGRRRCALLGIAMGLAVADAVEARPGSFERHDLVLGGEATASVVATGSDGRRSVVALVRARRSSVAADAAASSSVPAADGATPAQPVPRTRTERFLVRIDLEAGSAPRAERLAVTLPAGARSLLAADLDGDGADELLLEVGGDRAVAPVPGAPDAAAPPVQAGAGEAGEAGEAASSGASAASRILRLRGWAGGEAVGLEPLAHATGRRLGEAVVIPGAHGARLCFATLGLLDCLGTSGGAGDVGSVAQYRLPFSVALERNTLELASPPVGALPTAVDGRIAAVGPRAVGTRRLRVDLLAAEPTTPAAETWVRLPEPERVLAHRFVVVDGAPLLLVRTGDAAKIDVFGKQRLRVFRLDSDRTRGGGAPLVAVETPYYAWAPVLLEVHDHDGDGHLDLVLAGRQGLTQGDVAVMVLAGRGGGRFAAPRTIEIDAPGASFALGGDVDGDGRLDLVTLSRGELALRPGQASGSRPVASRPSGRLALGEPAGRRVVTIGVGGDGASVEEARVGEDQGDAAGEVGEVAVEEGEGQDGLAEDLGGAVAGDLEVHDLDGDGRVEVLVWAEDDAASGGGDDAGGGDDGASKKPAGTVLRLLRWRA